MASGIDPKVDYAFKRVFGSEESRGILTELLNAVLAGSDVRPICHVEILNPFSVKEVLDERQAILDIRARDDLGREYVVEMQMLAHRAFRERMLYYLAKDYAQMLVEGDDYKRLRPVIVVCFINDLLCPETSGYHGRYELREAATGVRFSNHWTIHIVELPKFQVPVTDLKDDIERWAYFLKHGQDLDSSELPTSLQTPGIRLATGVLDKMSHNTTERDQYEARLKYQRDQTCQIETAREEALATGEVIGIAKGRIEQLRDSILHIGVKRLGPVPAEIVDGLNAITTLARLDDLLDQVLDCASWDTLLDK
jgi:predicted transposase/invertase (TIGR01784 family)